MSSTNSVVGPVRVLRVLRVRRVDLSPLAVALLLLLSALAVMGAAFSTGSALLSVLAVDLGVALLVRLGLAAGAAAS